MGGAPHPDGGWATASGVWLGLDWVGAGWVGVGLGWIGLGIGEGCAQSRMGGHILILDAGRFQQAQGDGLERATPTVDQTKICVASVSDCTGGVGMWGCDFVP